ncbi:hypothetical protein [Alkalihalobacterium elongatum]|uniref:hypothetical protein n=1 Tax=Alkalihalobacterium elongatum TaxID=2675466 RepID=UPI001C1FF1E6|nr:hypothetical protein [Alkalihalobacterium elongatum]
MQLFHELYSVTKKLHDYVVMPFDKESEEESEAYITSVEELLAQRQRLIEQFQQEKPVVTENNQQLAEEIVEMNTVISKRLQANKVLLGNELKKVKLKKTQGKKYDNPYGGTTVEGVFFDKRGL